MAGLTIQQKEKAVIMLLIQLQSKAATVLISEVFGAVNKHLFESTITRPEIENFLNDLSANRALQFFPESGEIKILSLNKLSRRLAELDDNY